MRGLAAIVIVLSLVIFGAVGIGTLFGGWNPLQPLGFDHCGDRACFRGVIPGVTAWDEVVARFNTSSQLSDQYFIVTYPTYSVMFSPDTHDTTRAGDILVILEDEQLANQSALMTLYGAPCDARITYTSFDVPLASMRSPTYLSMGMVHGKRLSPSSPLRQIILSANNDTYCEQAKYWPWRGFRPIPPPRR
jgi:hypothetical protein